MYLAPRTHGLFIYKFRGVELNWFKSYLKDRQQFVMINGMASNLLNILQGVPQGSILDNIPNFTSMISPYALTC
jgi:hypothetical protein